MKIEHCDGTITLPYDGRFVVFSPFSHRVAITDKNPLKCAATRSQCEQHGFFRAPGEVDQGFKGFTSITLFLTSKCNLACIYCYGEANQFNFEMNLELAQKSIDYFLRQYHGDTLRLGFHGGGEQTLAADNLRQVVAYAKTATSRQGCSKYYFLITTNGVVKITTLEFLMEERFAITISLDGDPSIQNRLRPLRGGQASSDAVEKTVKKLVQAEYPFAVRPTITAETVDNIPSILRYFADLGIKNVILQPLFSCGRCRISGTEAPDPLHFADRFLEALSIGRELGLRFMNSSFQNILCGKPSYYCGAASAMGMTVTPDGYLTGCFEVTNAQHELASEFIIGKHDGNDSFELYHDKIRRLRSRTTDAVCGECSLKYICGATCPAQARQATGSIFSPEPSACAVAKRLIPELITRIAEESRSDCVITPVV